MKRNRKIIALEKVDRDNNKSILSIEDSLKYKTTKQKMKIICKNLCHNTASYSPNDTVEVIKIYIDEKNKLDRILYSEISNYFFSLDDEKRGVFLTNIESLLIYTLKEDESDNNLNKDVRKIIIKLYDHIQLAAHQIENASNIFQSGIVDAKEGLRFEVKSIEKEYITILGIFASIVLTFSAGVSFSSSTLSNLSGISFARIFIIVDFLAMILVTSIYLLVNFIRRINTSENANYSFILWFNIIAVIIIVVVIMIANCYPSIFTNL